MSKKTKNANAPVVLADLHEHTRVKYNAEDVQKFDAVSDDLLRAIVAGGVFDINNGIIDDTLGVLAAKRYQANVPHDAIVAFCDRLKAAGMSSWIDTASKEKRYLADVAYDYAFSFGEAGYLLGVLVGRTMGGAR